MKKYLRTVCAVVGIVAAGLASQPALADGGWGHYRGHGYYQGGSWGVPFAIGAVMGGVAIGAMMQPQPVYAQPMYAPPPPVYVRPRIIVPPPVYAVPPPPPPVYYTY